jgi:endonuclease YncB( thermonuclease family)
MPAKKKKSFPIKKLLFPILALSIIFNLYFLVDNYLPSVGDSNGKSKTQVQGKVIKIIDGDTFILDKDQQIKLAGADAPEAPQGCLADQAKNRLEQLLKNKKVQLEVITKDNLDRQVAYVFLNGAFIDEVMVEEGLAQAESNNSNYDAQLLSAQDEAQKLEKGIWSLTCQPQAKCLIKGNVSKDGKTKIYHLPGCYNYDKIVIKEEEGDQWFCSEWEAQWQGFTPSQDCP